jgi:hypothetical protein
MMTRNFTYLVKIMELGIYPQQGKKRKTNKHHACAWDKIRTGPARARALLSIDVVHNGGRYIYICRNVHMHAHI